MDKVKKIINVLHNSISGHNWSGENYLGILTTIKSENVSIKVGSLNTMGQIFQHIIVWRIFTFEKLNGNFSYNITPEIDWDKNQLLIEGIWKDTIEEFKNINEKLIEVLSTKTDEVLESQVPGRDYDFYTLLHGIIQHDHYHFGQIVLLNKLIEENPLSKISE